MIKEILNGEVKKAINCVREKDANITKTGQTVDVGFFPVKYLKIKYTSGWLLIIFSKNLNKPELAVFDIFIYLLVFLKLDKMTPFLET